ncbi:MAG: hypothetical protein PHQ34_08160 [Methanothrix sp.]|nr:hypothetical protein [Methanothrix sp.]
MRQVAGKCISGYPTSGTARARVGGADFGLAGGSRHAIGSRSLDAASQLPSARRKYIIIVCII